ncbi:hypothetical protein ACA910_013491 [Epithemia clementina (nom. ined.)]
MPQSKDPFPMSSLEAERLAASVEGAHGGSSGSNHWNSMSTKTMGGASSGVMGDEKATEASRRLVGEEGAGGSRPHNTDDIYEDIDNDADDAEDDFLDKPLWETRGSTVDRILGATKRGLHKIYVRLYGEDLPLAEMLRTLCMASTLLFMIGGYWTLRSLKDAIVMTLNGVEYIPIAKMASVGVILCVVPIYNSMLDSGMPRHHLFYLFGSIYFGLFSCIGFLLMHPTIGLENQRMSPYRLLGWVSYCGIESFGSVMISLYWAFANSNFTFKTAKASYGVMVATGQIGSILGPTLVNMLSESWGPAKLYLLGAFCMLLFQGTMYLYIYLYGAAERNSTGVEAPKKKESAGVLEGLHLFIKHNYVKGIFAISCLFMVEVTIIDFTLKVLARNYFAEEHPCDDETMSCFDPINGNHGLSHDATAAVSRFLGFFGQATNGLSLVMSLFGTSAVIRILGLRLTLLLFPSLCLCVVIMVRLSPTLNVVFLAMILLKGFSYSLNNPTKEMLYQPTSQAVRYKAKSWIDTFGARGSKALGSVITHTFSHSTSSLIANGSLVAIAVATFLIWNATYMGRKVDEYTESGYIVGEESSGVSEDGGNHVELGLAQNEAPDTSCAIDDDDGVVALEGEGQKEDAAATKSTDEEGAQVARV